MSREQSYVAQVDKSYAGNSAPKPINMAASAAQALDISAGILRRQAEVLEVLRGPRPEPAVNPGRIEPTNSLQSVMDLINRNLQLLAVNTEEISNLIGHP
jgi:hypothetical protein